MEAEQCGRQQTRLSLSGIGRPFLLRKKGENAGGEDGQRVEGVVAQHPLQFFRQRVQRRRTLAKENGVKRIGKAGRRGKGREESEGVIRRLRE